MLQSGGVALLKPDVFVSDVSVITRSVPLPGELEEKNRQLKVGERKVNEHRRAEKSQKYHLVFK